MKRMAKLFLAVFVAALLSSPATINAESDVTTTDATQTVFSEDNLDGSLKVENTEDGNLYIQDFKEKVEVPSTRAASSAKIYTVIDGREILTEEEFIERKNAPKTRATLTDSYNDGRGTHLYVEIVYSQQKIKGENAAKFMSLYCNSSGSTLSSYSVTFGQSGVNQNNGGGFSRRVTENISTTKKTFSRNIDSTYNWPALYFGPGNEMVIGATQYYNCRGYSKSWTVNV